MSRAVVCSRAGQHHVHLQLQVSRLQKLRGGVRRGAPREERRRRQQVSPAASQTPRAARAGTDIKDNITIQAPDVSLLNALAQKLSQSKRITCSATAAVTSLYVAAGRGSPVPRVRSDRLSR